MEEGEAAAAGMRKNGSYYLLSPTQRMPLLPEANHIFGAATPEANIHNSFIFISDAESRGVMCLMPVCFMRGLRKIE